MHTARVCSPDKPIDSEILRQELEIIWKRRALTEKYMEPKFGLVAELESIGRLSESDRELVDSRRTPTEQNQQIIDFVRQKASMQLDKFIEALIRCDQEHVVNWLLNRAGICYYKL